MERFLGRRQPIGFFVFAWRVGLESIGPHVKETRSMLIPPVATSFLSQRQSASIHGACAKDVLSRNLHLPRRLIALRLIEA